jgi:FMN reductase
MKVAVVVGNPKAGSRTRAAGELVAEKLTGKPADNVIEVVEIGAKLLGWGDPDVAAAKQIVLDSDLIIWASPTFKATYTGLIKLFLDQFGQGELVGRFGVAMMLGAAPNHALAPELTFKPVLVEIGLTTPLPGLYLLDSEYESSPVLDAWLERAKLVLPDLVAS